MERRHFVAIASLSGFAGCLGNNSLLGSDDDDVSPNDTDSGNPPANDDDADLPEEFDQPGHADQFTAHGPWPTAQGNPARTGLNTEARLPQDPTKVGAAWLRWVEGVHHKGPYLRELVTDDRHVFVGHNDPNSGDAAVTAYAGKDGDREWTTVLDRDELSTATVAKVESLSYARGRLYVTGSRSDDPASILTTLDPDDGTVAWEQTVPGKAGNAMIADHQTVHAYDTSGDRLWQDSMEVGEASLDDEYTMNPMLAVAHDMLYVGLVDGRLYAFGETA